MSAILAGLGLATDLFSMFGANAAEKRAEEERRNLLNQMAVQNDTDYQNLRSNNMQAMRQSTGLLGDALYSQGRSLGAANAGAGVYNSSATAGTLANSQAANASALAGLAMHNFQNEQGLLGQQKQNLLQTQLQFAASDEARARQSQGTALGAVGGGISDLIGALSPRNNGAYMNGNQGAAPVMPGQTGIGGPLGLASGTGGVGSVLGAGGALAMAPGMGGLMGGAGVFDPSMFRGLFGGGS